MAGKLHILIVFFCLGIFIVPKQNLFAQLLQQDCCSVSSSGDCCPSPENDSKPCHGGEKKSCGGDCTSCKSCSTTTVFASIAPDLKVTDNAVAAADSSKGFCYLSPELSDSAAKIWQPPKIG